MDDDAPFLFCLYSQIHSRCNPTLVMRILSWAWDRKGTESGLVVTRESFHHLNVTKEIFRREIFALSKRIDKALDALWDPRCQESELRVLSVIAFPAITPKQHPIDCLLSRTRTACPEPPFTKICPNPIQFNKYAAPSLSSLIHGGVLEWTLSLSNRIEPMSSCHAGVCTASQY